MRLLVVIVLIAQAGVAYADAPSELTPEPTEGLSEAARQFASEVNEGRKPAAESAGDASEGGSASTSETQSVAEPVMESLNLDFGELQMALARRLFPRSAWDLFSAPLPPLVVADGFGLLVDRNFGP